MTLAMLECVGRTHPCSRTRNTRWIPIRQRCLCVLSPTGRSVGHCMIQRRLAPYRPYVWTKHLSTVHQKSVQRDSMCRLPCIICALPCRCDRAAWLHTAHKHNCIVGLCISRSGFYVLRQLRYDKKHRWNTSTQRQQYFAKANQVRMTSTI